MINVYKLIYPVSRLMIFQRKFLNSFPGSLPIAFLCLPTTNGGNQERAWERSWRILLLQTPRYTVKAKCILCSPVLVLLLLFLCTFLLSCKTNSTLILRLLPPFCLLTEGVTRHMYTTDWKVRRQKLRGGYSYRPTRGQKCAMRIIFF